MCNWTLEVRDILKILWKRGESNFSSFPQYFFLHVVRFSCLGRTDFSLRDKRLFEVSEFEIARVNCKFKNFIYENFHFFFLVVKY